MTTYDPIAEALGMSPLNEEFVFNVNDYEHTRIGVSSCFDKHDEQTKIIMGEKAQERLKRGDNIFLDLGWQKAKNKKRLENGTHNFLNKEWQSEQNRKRIANGTHNFLDPEARKRYAQKQLSNGNHVTKNSELQSAKGKKAWSDMPRVTCPHCNKMGAKPVMSKYHFDKCKLIAST